jgi:hypothetical protein
VLVGNKSFVIFEERLGRKIKNQLGELDDNVETIKARAAADGLVQSSCIIKDVKGLYIKALDSRVDYIFEFAKDISLKYSSRKLRTKISKISLKYFPEDLGELYTRLDKLIRFTNSVSATDHIINELRGANTDAINKYWTELDLFIEKRKADKISSRLNKLIIPLFIPIVGALIVNYVSNYYPKTSQNLVISPI